MPEIQKDRASFAHKIAHTFAPDALGCASSRSKRQAMGWAFQFRIADLSGENIKTSFASLSMLIEPVDKQRLFSHLNFLVIWY